MATERPPTLSYSVLYHVEEELRATVAAVVVAAVAVQVEVVEFGEIVNVAVGLAGVYVPYRRLSRVYPHLSVHHCYKRARDKIQLKGEGVDLRYVSQNASRNAAYALATHHAG